MATPTLPCPGPTRGRNCYVILAFSGVPKQGDKIRSGYFTLAFSEGHTWAEVLGNPYILGGPKTRGQNQKWLLHLCLFEGPPSGRKCYVTPAFSRVAKQGNKVTSGYSNPAFLGAHKSAEVLHNPYILGGPQTRGPNQKWLLHPCLLWGPQVGGIAM